MGCIYIKYSICCAKSKFEGNCPIKLFHFQPTVMPYADASL